jgi:hypothetical protein
MIPFELIIRPLYLVWRSHSRYLIRCGSIIHSREFAIRLHFIYTPYAKIGENFMLNSEENSQKYCIKNLLKF